MSGRVSETTWNDAIRCALNSYINSVIRVCYKMKQDASSASSFYYYYYYYAALLLYCGCIISAVGADIIQGHFTGFTLSLCLAAQSSSLSSSSWSSSVIVVVCRLHQTDWRKDGRCFYEWNHPRWKVRTSTLIYWYQGRTTTTGRVWGQNNTKILWHAMKSLRRVSKYSRPCFCYFNWIGG